jgi:hypothetical protein
MTGRGMSETVTADGGVLLGRGTYEDSFSWRR